MSASGRPLALVTGGGRRLGRSIALALGDAGYDVAISFRSSSNGAREVVDRLQDAGVEAAAYHADLSQVTDCQGLIDAVFGELGPIALLVNNAGVLERVDPEHPDADAFDRAMAVNLRAPYLLSVAAARSMREAGGGCIVQIASLGGFRPYKHHLPYSLSKAGLLQLTRGLAIQFAPDVRVNAIAPGTVELPEQPSELPMPPASRIPLRRHARAEEIAHAVLYLAEAGYVTGQVLRLDGGIGIESAASDPPGESEA